MSIFQSRLAELAAELAKANTSGYVGVPPLGYGAPTHQQAQAEAHGKVEAAASAAAAVGAALQKQTEQLLHEARMGAQEMPAFGTVEERLAALERRVAKLQGQLSKLLHALHGLGH
jgi:HPt (histidine-containing phosphotransfer) domain-containing protein